jgi:hypothetical protein
VARHLETTERKIEALTRLRRELRNTLNSCKGGRIAECRVIQALSAVAATRKRRLKATPGLDGRIGAETALLTAWRFSRLG